MQSSQAIFSRLTKIGVFVMAGLERTVGFLLVLVFLAVVPSVNGKPRSSCVEDTVSEQSLPPSFPSVRVWKVIARPTPSAIRGTVHRVDVSALRGTMTLQDLTAQLMVSVRVCALARRQPAQCTQPTVVLVSYPDPPPLHFLYTDVIGVRISSVRCVELRSPMNTDLVEHLYVCVTHR